MPTQDMLESEGPPYTCPVCKSGLMPAWPQYEEHLKSKNHVKKVFNLPMNAHISLDSRKQSLGLLGPSVPAPAYQADDSDFPTLGGAAASQNQAYPLLSSQTQNPAVQYCQIAPRSSSVTSAAAVAASTISQVPLVDNRTQSERSGNVRLAPSLDQAGRPFGVPRFADVPKLDTAREMLRAYLNGKSEKLAHQMLNEYCSQMRGTIEYVPTSPMVGGNFAYYVTLTIDGITTEYESGEAQSKQKAKEQSAKRALNVIARGNRPASPTRAQTPAAAAAAASVALGSTAPSLNLPGDMYAQLCQNQLDCLLGPPVNIVRVNKVAAIFLSDSRSAEPKVELVALGTGSGCSDDCLEHIFESYGERVIDGTAFTCAKRALRIRLAQEVSAYVTAPGRTGSAGWLEPNRQGDRLRLKPGLALHLFLSAPPDGDCSAGDSASQDAGAGLFARQSQDELLRDRCGVLEPDLSRYGSLTCYESCDCSAVRTFSEEEAADPSSLAVHCGSDKLLRCNYLGLQGGLLANFIEPIFLQSVDVAGSYSHGDMARGFLCRLPGARFRASLAAAAYRTASDPWLGRTSNPFRLCQRGGINGGDIDYGEAVLSVNWYRPMGVSGQGQVEVLNSSLGVKEIYRSQNVTDAERQQPDAATAGGISRLSKRAALNRIVKLAKEAVAMSGSASPTVARINERLRNKLARCGADFDSISMRSLKCEDYAKSKKIFFEELVKHNRGAWATKNGEMDPSDFCLLGSN